MDKEMMAQIAEQMKVKHPGCMAMIRNNDNYYCYNEKADDVPRYFEARKLDLYLPKIIRQGIKVAIVDTDPETSPR
jgi:DNA mismatch repair ATPase MutS